MSATIKDLKEIQMIRSEADTREQEARIANLERQARAEMGKDNVVTVRLMDGTEEFAG